MDSHINEILPQETTAFKKKTEVIKGCLSILEEENTKLECILNDLDLLNSDIELAIGKYTNLHLRSEAKECTIGAISLSMAEKQRKQNNYLSKMKICMKIYSNLNEKLGKELKLIKSQLKQSKDRIASFETISKEEFKCLEAKIKHYDNELLKYEKKYPWLRDPQLNLPNIANEIKNLNTLREKKNLLLEELSHYRDLKPDILEASHQLNKVKQEHKQFKLAI